MTLPLDDEIQKICEAIANLGSERDMFLNNYRAATAKNNHNLAAKHLQASKRRNALINDYAQVLRDMIESTKQPTEEKVNDTDH